MSGITLIPVTPSQSPAVAVEKITFFGNNQMGQIAQQEGAPPIAPGVYAVKELNDIQITVLPNKWGLTDFQWKPQSP